MPLDGSALLGRVHKLFVDPAGDLTTPTWTEYGKIQGASRSGGKDVAEIKERDLIDTTVLPGHRNTEITLPITRRPGDTEYDALEDAFHNDAKISIALMTGEVATIGERGYQAEMYVTQWDDDQAHDGTAVQVTLRPAADYVVAPDFIEVV